MPTKYHQCIWFMANAFKHIYQPKPQKFDTKEAAERWLTKYVNTMSQERKQSFPLCLDATIFSDFKPDWLGFWWWSWQWTLAKYTSLLAPHMSTKIKEIASSNRIPQITHLWGYLRIMHSINIPYSNFHCRQLWLEKCDIYSFLWLQRLPYIFVPQLIYL